MKNLLSAKKVNRSAGGNAVTMFFLILFSVFMLIPMIFVVSNAFKPMDELFIYPPKLFPQHPTISNFSDMITILSQSWVPFSRYFFNTVFVTVVGTVGHLFVASMAAYTLAKHNFPGKKFLFEIVAFVL